MKIHTFLMVVVVAAYVSPLFGAGPFPEIGKMYVIEHGSPTDSYDGMHPREVKILSAQGGPWYLVEFEHKVFLRDESIKNLPKGSKMPDPKFEVEVRRIILNFDWITAAVETEQ